MPSLFETGQAQPQPIIRKHGLIQRLAPAPPDSGKHECVLLGAPALSTPFVDRPAHCFRNRNPAVIGAPVAVLAFDLFRLKLAAPSRVHDLIRRALVRARCQPEALAGAERTERGDEEDGAVAGRPKTG